MAKDPYAAVAKNTGLEIPELFRRMVADGVTTYPADDWRKASLENPSALLMASFHVEWMDPKDIAEHEPEDHWDKKLTLVPFAQNGAGDLWCFHPGGKHGEEIPIALVIHDELDAEIFAPSFEGFLFRQLLNALAEIDPSQAKYTPEETLKCVGAEIKTLTPYVRKEWIDVLKEVASRPMTTKPKSGYRSFITFNDAKALAATTFGYDKLDSTFRYTSDA